MPRPKTSLTLERIDEAVCSIYARDERVTFERIRKEVGVGNMQTIIALARKVPDVGIPLCPRRPPATLPFKPIKLPAWKDYPPGLPLALRAVHDTTPVRVVIIGISELIAVELTGLHARYRSGMTFPELWERTFFGKPEGIEWASEETNEEVVPKVWCYAMTVRSFVKRGIIQDETGRLLRYLTWMRDNIEAFDQWERDREC